MEAKGSDNESKQLQEKFNATFHDFLADFVAFASEFAPTCYIFYLQNAGDNLKRRIEADDCPKESIENFEILGSIGKGFFSTVFKARHERKICAIKVHEKLPLARKPRILKFVLQEKGILSALDSPFFLKVFFAFQDPGNLYLVTEFALYGDLRFNFEAICKSYSEPLIKLFAAQIFLALEYIHACGYLYNDLKLENILMFEDKYLKLCDLGVAQPDFTQFKDDWWGFAVVLHELLLGRKPDFRDTKTKESFFNYEKADASDRDLSCDAKDLLGELLMKREENRLGVAKTSDMEIRDHAWFGDINFLHVFHKVINMRDLFPGAVEPAVVDASVGIPRRNEPVSDQKPFERY